MDTDEKAQPSLTIDGENVTLDDAIEFLASFEATVGCPICAAKKWNVSLTPGDEQYLFLATTGGKGSVKYGLAFFITECDSCGYTRLHSLAKLAEWKKKKKSTAPSHGGEL
ncbi:hypothetical protein [Stenotrophomonas rhizophila]|uniref:hypothetical protein n=1 Tax=Stenotrophomonas rhizophila TaxID=216778 RepID=UPI0015E84CDA|nr:hypothetical protein [Stenotrophomonas rhizophila]